MTSDEIRSDCCDSCAEADKEGGCHYKHANGVGLIARCAPLGTKNGDGCGSCIPCEGHHLKGTAYFTSGADMLFREKYRIRSRPPEPRDKRKRSRKGRA